MSHRSLQAPLQVLAQSIKQVLGAGEEPPAGRVWVELQVLA